MKCLARWPGVAVQTLRRRCFSASAVDPVTRLLLSEPQLSHVIGPTSDPLLDLSVDDLFLRGLGLAEQAGRTASGLVCPEQKIRLSHRELDAAIQVAARGLVELNIGKGDRVAAWLPNVAEYLILQYATARIGAVLVTLNPAYRHQEALHALNLVGAKCLVVVPSVARSDYVQMTRRLLDGGEISSLESVLTVSGLPNDPDDCEIARSIGSMAVGWSEVMDASSAGQHNSFDAEVERLRQTVDVCDTINIQFTSGTTGLPKAVALTHHNLVNNGHFVGRQTRIGTEDTVCIAVPLFHCFGLVLGSLACASSGAGVVFPSVSFNPTKTLEAVEAERCTSLYGVPTMFISELSLPNFESFDLSSLRTGIMAGSVCPADTMQRVITQETSPVSWQSEAGTTPFDKLLHTVGRVHPHVECKVIDAATGGTVPLGEPGELLTRGYSVMEGYYDNVQATEECLDGDGWMHTGDVVVIDEGGYCSIVGRSKDTIIRGGENIAPREVEDAIFSHADVEVASVVGVRDSIFGEQVCACIILKPNVDADERTAEMIREHCREALSHFKVPKYVRFMQHYPMTVSGKIQKHVLVTESNTDLGL